MSAVDSADDNAIVRRVCAGERQAYRDIVTRHQEKIFYLGLKFFHNPHDAEDFAQDVFLRAYERLSTFRAEVPFGAWLYRLAFNLAVNRYHYNLRRLEAQLPEDAGDEERQDESADAADPGRQLLDKELKQRVQAAMKTLPEAYQIILHMSYYGDLSYPEISRILEIPVNTIKSHVFRAKRLIRKELSHE